MNLTFALEGNGLVQKSLSRCGCSPNLWNPNQQKGASGLCVGPGDVGNPAAGSPSDHSISQSRPLTDPARRSVMIEQSVEWVVGRCYLSNSDVGGHCPHCASRS